MNLSTLPSNACSATSSHKLSKFPAWLIFWSCLLMIVGIKTVTGWWQCLSTRSISDNLIPFLTVIFLTLSVKKYYLSQPLSKTDLHTGGVLLLSCFAFLTAASDYLHFARLTWIGFLGLAAGLLFTLKGRQFFNHWCPLFLFALFLSPGAPIAFINWLSAWMKTVSIKVALAISSLAIPITVENFTFYVKGEAFEVGTACCGLAMLTSLSFVIMLWNLYKPKALMPLVLNLVAVGFVSMLMNGIRIALTAIIAFYFSKDLALATHTYLELPLFVLAVALMWFIFSKTPTRIDSSYNTDKTLKTINPNRNRIIATIISIALLIPVIEILTAPSVDSKSSRCVIPNQFGRWKGTDIAWTELMKKNYHQHVDVNITWRSYRQGKDKPVFCLVQQASNYENIHDVFACLKLAGSNPKCIAVKKLKQRNMVAPPYSLYEYSYKNRHFYTLFLYQSKAGPAIFPARNFKEQINLAITGRIPCRLIEVSTEVGGEPAKATARLENLASNISKLPI